MSQIGSYLSAQMCRTTLISLSKRKKCTAIASLGCEMSAADVELQLITLCLFWGHLPIWDEFADLNVTRRKT